jgi:FolB domain-containing protein
MQAKFNMIIKIKDFEIDCNIGVYEWERTFNRKLIINVEMHLKNNNFINSRKLCDTIDYQLIYNNIKKIVNSKYYELIEDLAIDIIDMILQNELICQATIEIDKMKIFEDVKSCSVFLSKSKN